MKWLASDLNRATIEPCRCREYFGDEGSHLGLLEDSSSSVYDGFTRTSIVLMLGMSRMLSASGAFAPEADQPGGMFDRCSAMLD